MITKLSLKSKLLLLSGAVNLCLILLIALSFNALNRVGKSYQYIAEVNLRKTRLIADARGGAKDITRNVIRLSLPANEKQEVDHVVEKLKKLETKYLENLEKYHALPQEEQEGPLYQALNEATQIFLESTHKTVAQSVKEGDAERSFALQMLKTEYRKSYDDIMFPALDKLINFQNEISEKHVADASRIKNQAHQLLIALGTSITLFSLGLMYAFSSYVSKSLKNIAKSLGVESNKVATASQQLSASSTELSSVCTEQSSSIQETSSTIEEISAMISRTSDNTSASRKLAHSCHESTEKGKKAVDCAFQAMNDINSSNEAVKSQINENNQNLSEIVKVISEIGNKTKVINDIVFQTKLLSFNASVEAARAGEHGKGFAVVAEEVGNLAQMSGNAAKEITSMLDESIKRVQDIAHTSRGKIEQIIQTAQVNMTKGTAVVHECNQSLDEIAKKISELNEMISEIDSATNQQSTGVKEVNSAIAMLTEATQQNTTVASQSSSAAETLSAQAQDLKKLVHDLTHIIEGASASPRTHDVTIDSNKGNQATEASLPDIRLAS